MCARTGIFLSEQGVPFFGKIGGKPRQSASPPSPSTPMGGRLVIVETRHGTSLHTRGAGNEEVGGGEIA